MILCLGTTPAVQRVMIFRQLTLDAVNRAAATLDGIAGKSINVAKVLRVLGGHPLATGFLGGHRGAFIRATLDELGIEHEFVSVAPSTRECVTVIAESACMQTELVEESQPVEADDFVKLRASLARFIPRCRAVVMSGTITPGGPVELYAEVTRQAHAAGAISVVDAQGAPLLAALAAKPGLVKPNRAELAATVGRALTDAESVRSAMRELCERGAQRAVVTVGRDPTLAFDGRHFWSVVPPRIDVVNPIGSGDSFTAGLVWRLLQGDDLGEACRWGAAAGSANALTAMAGEVRREDVDRLAGEVRIERLSE